LGIPENMREKENLIDLDNFNKGTIDNKMDLADTLANNIEKKIQKI
jgi:hypothetical protein